MNTNSPLFGRRDFLALSSAGLSALLLSMGSAARAAKLLPVGTRPDGFGPVSIAYWQGSENLPDLDWQTAAKGLDPESLPPLVPAVSLPTGDSLFEGTGVRLKMHGMFPAPEAKSLSGRASVWLDVVFEPTAPLVCHIWELRGGAWPNCSSPVSQLVPVDDEVHSLWLQGELRDVVATATVTPGGRSAGVVIRGGKPPKQPPARVRRRAFSTRLTTRDEVGVPKLLRGFYLIGVPGTIDGTEPDWNSDPRENATQEYTCVLVSVDYGDVPK